MRVTLPVTLLADTADALRACVVCGEPLDGKRKHAVTCSPRCRQAKSRAGEANALDRRSSLWREAAATVDHSVPDWAAITLDLAARALIKPGSVTLADYMAELAESRSSTSA